MGMLAVPCAAGRTRAALRAGPYLGMMQKGGASIVPKEVESPKAGAHQNLVCWLRKQATLLQTFAVPTMLTMAGMAMMWPANQHR